MAKKAKAVKKAAKKVPVKKPIKKTLQKKTNPVVHFEVPYDDAKRMSKFYTRAFGWKMIMLGEEMGNYVLAQTSETDKNGMVKGKGMINGGFFRKDDKMSSNHPSLVMAVDNIKASMKKLEKAGGKVINGPHEIPGYGLYVQFTDTEGNIMGLIQPFMR